MAAPDTTQHPMRRSTRLRIELPVRLRSVDPNVPYDRACTTLIVNSHGCGIQTNSAIQVGTAVEVVVYGKPAGGTVVNSAQLSPNSWVVGIELKESGNIWGIKSPPADWGIEVRAAAVGTAKRHPFAKQRAARPQLVPAPAPAPDSATEPAVLPAAGQEDTAAAGVPPEEGESLRSLEKQLAESLLRSTEASMAGLRTRVDELLAAREHEISSRLAEESGRAEARVISAGEERLREIEAAAENAMQGVDEHRQRVRQVQQELEAKARQALDDIDQRQATMEQAAAAAAQAIDDRTAHSLASVDAHADGQRQELEKSAAGLREELANLAQQHALELQGRLADVIGAGEEQLDAALKARASENTAQYLRQQEAAAERLQQDASAATATVTRAQAEALQQLAAGVERHRAELEELQQSARGELNEVLRRSDMLLGETEATLLKNAQELVAGELAHGREQLRASAAEIREAEMAALDEHRGRTRQEQQDLEMKTRQALDKIEARQAAIEQAAEAASTATQAQVEALKQLAAGIERHRTELEGLQQSARGELNDVLRRSDVLLSETEARLLKNAQELVAAELAHGREQLRASAAEIREAEIAGIREAAMQQAAGQVQKSNEAVAELVRATDRLLALQAKSETGIAQLQEQLQDARKWLSSQTEGFQQTVHDAFLQAGGEIRGRIHAAVDTADVMIAQKARDAAAQLDSTAQARQASSQAVAAEIERKLAEIQKEAARSAEMMLKERLAATLDQFSADATKLAESAATRWQNAMQETLRSIPTLMTEKLSDPSAKDSGGGRG